MHLQTDLLQHLCLSLLDIELTAYLLEGGGGAEIVGSRGFARRAFSPWPQKALVGVGRSRRWLELCNCSYLYSSLTFDGCGAEASPFDELKKRQETRG